jgi:Putative metallopeptidase
VNSVNNLVDRPTHRASKIKAKSWLAVMTAVVTTLSTSILPTALNPSPAQARANDLNILLRENGPRLVRGKGKIRAIYKNSSTEVGQRVVNTARDQKMLEVFSSLITRRVGLPRDVKVSIQDCGIVNAFYSPDQHSITMCTELIATVAQQFINAGNSEDKAVQLATLTGIFVFFHEAGHMLISELDLPITGREEDVADQFAANVFLNWLGNDSETAEFGQAVVAAAAQWFSMNKDNLESTLTFMDEHSLNQQRFLSLLCMLYVKNPDDYAKFVVNLGFDSNRLRRCRGELRQIARSWDKLLAPHLIKS